ncbi:hypothetical protein BH09MYX1_BH09MYX1_51070 [soil metagenome]
MALYWAVISGLVAVGFEWRMWSIATAYAAAGVVALRFPERRYEATAIANFFFAVASAIIWSSHGLEREAERLKKRANDA